MDTVKELVQAFRDDEKDAEAPYFWSDAQLVRWLNLALSRFCEKTRCIHDCTSSFTLIDFLEGEAVLPRHHCIIDIVQARIEGPNGVDLEVEAPGYTRSRDLPRTGRPRLMVVDNTDLRLYAPPTEAGQLQLEVIRRPIKQVTINDRIPDVPVSEREHLLLYMKHRAYRVSDGEIFDPAKADNYLGEFDDRCQEYYDTAQSGRRSGPIRYRGF